MMYYNRLREIITKIRLWYASLRNHGKAKAYGIANIVFNKIVASLENIVTSANMETRLKKWRSAIEPVISKERI